jgi:hypothetical protein
VEKVPDGSGEPVLAALCHVLSEEDLSGQHPNISHGNGGTLLVDEVPASFLLVDVRHLLAPYWWRKYST